MNEEQLQLVGVVEILERDGNALGHGLFTLTDPDTGLYELAGTHWRKLTNTYVKVLLVGLVVTVGVADSSEEVVLLVQHIVTDASHVGKLHVGVHVDLDDTVADGIEVLLLSRAGAAVEDKEDRLVVAGANGGLDVSLVLAKELGVQLDVAGLVDTVDVAETGSDGEVGRNGGESVVNVENVLGLSVERGIVNVLVVDAVLLTTSDANLHLEPLLHGRSALEVSGGGLNVPVDRLLGKINHVRAEERLTRGLEVSLVGIKHAIEPGKKLLGTVVSVEDDRDTVGGGNGSDVVSTSNGAGNGSRLVTVGNALETVRIASRRIGSLGIDSTLPAK